MEHSRNLFLSFPAKPGLPTAPSTVPAKPRLSTAPSTVPVKPGLPTAPPADSHVQRKHFDTGSESIICTPKATDTEIVSSSTTCDSVTVTDEPKNDSSITDSHVQRKYVKRGSKYKSKANWKYGTSQKLKFPRVNKRISKPMKTSKGGKKNKSTSKIKIGYIHKSNLNYFSNAMTFYNRLLLKQPRVKYKNKLY